MNNRANLDQSRRMNQINDASRQAHQRSQQHHDQLRRQEQQRQIQQLQSSTRRTLEVANSGCCVVMVLFGAGVLVLAAIAHQLTQWL